MDCEKVRDLAVSEMEAEISVQEHSHEMSAQATWIGFIGVSVAIVVFGISQGEEGMTAWGAAFGFIAMLVFWSSERRIRSAFEWLRTIRRAIIEHEFERCIEAHGPAASEEE